MTGHNCLWSPPPPDLALSSDDVHVWLASLDQPAERIQQLSKTLSHDERMRASRFNVEDNRNRFIVCRGILRTILGSYLGREPSKLRFSYGCKGKPALAETENGSALRFNLSHSWGLALYAVTNDREIGVDIERVRPISSVERIAERFFSPRENAVLRTLPDNLKHEAFFSCWTRKEAYVKAKGEGLSIPLSQFDVSLGPGEPAALLSTKWHPQEVYRWSLKELNPAPGYVGALAVEGHYQCFTTGHFLFEPIKDNASTRIPPAGR